VGESGEKDGLPEHRQMNWRHWYKRGWRNESWKQFERRRDAYQNERSVSTMSSLHPCTSIITNHIHITH